MKREEIDVDGFWTSLVVTEQQKARAVWAIITAHSFLLVTDRKLRAGVKPQDAAVLVEAMEEATVTLKKLDREFGHENN